MLDPSATGNGCVSEFRVTNLEMIKVRRANLSMARS